MRRLYISLFFLLALGLLFCASAAAAQPRQPEKVYRIAFTGAYPDAHPVVEEVFTPWAAKLAEKSRNRLIITYYGPDILVPEETHLDAIQRGAVPLAQQSVGKSAGRLGLSSFLHVPGGISSSQSGTAAFWRMYRNVPELRKEYENYKLLSLHASAPVQLHLNFQLKDINELKGKRILCQDAYLAAMLKAAGAIPLIMPERDFYRELGLQKADGAAMPFDMLMAYNLDSLPFMQSVCVNLCVAPYWTAMNKAAWEALPRELQRILDAEINEAWAMKIAATLDLATAAGKARLAGRGVHIKDLSRSETEAWRNRMAPAARDLWISNMNAARFKDAEKILERAASFYKDSESAHGR